MLNYKWISTKYYLDKDEKINEVKIPYWQNLPLTNYETINFYFLINNFFYTYKNINSIFVASFSNSNLNLYNQIKDDKNLLPLKFNYQINDISFLNDFIYLRNSSFINFFINNLIDVPICFKKSKSLKTKNFELPLLKFSNFLMRKGKKEKIINLMFTSFRTFFKEIRVENLIIEKKDLSWLNLYFFLSNTTWYRDAKDSEKLNFISENNLTLSYNNNLFNGNKAPNISFFLKNYLYSLISKVSPVFSYFIYSVDKNIRKYSRGKSGKYTFIWKYVAPYKRIQLGMRWVVKDIKFFQSKKFEERFSQTLSNLITSPNKSFAWKSKVFSHNYVFKNFRKSLMSSLKTTT